MFITNTQATNVMLKNHLYIFSTIFFTVYSQLIMRWQVSSAGSLPEGGIEKCLFVGHLLFKPWVLSSIIATFLAGVSWMLAMTKFEISYAYPWTALNFVLMLLLGVFLFNESLNLQKLIGTLIVIVGIVLVARA